MFSYSMLCFYNYILHVIYVVSGIWIEYKICNRSNVYQIYNVCIHNVIGHAFCLWLLGISQNECRCPNRWRWYTEWGLFSRDRSPLSWVQIWSTRSCKCHSYQSGLFIRALRPLNISGHFTMTTVCWQCALMMTLSRCFTERPCYRYHDTITHSVLVSYHWVSHFVSYASNGNQTERVLLN